MTSFLEAAVAGVRRAYCKTLEGVDNYYGFWGSLGIPVGEVPPALKKFVCDEDGPPPPPPPFTGGQCPGVLYTIFYNRTENPLSRDSDVRRLGPVVGLVDEPGENSAGDPGTFTFLVTEGGATKNQISFVPDGGEPSGWFITNVVRTDGQPDDCGDPEPDVPPYVPVPISEPIDYDDPDGNPVSEPADITFNIPIIVPVIPVTIYAPFTFNLGGQVFNGTLELSPQFNVNFDLSGSDPSPGLPEGPLEPADPITSPNTPVGDSVESLIGVIVRSRPAATIAQTELGQRNSPTLFVPRIGSVYFRTRNREVDAWNGPHDIKTTNAYIPVPENVFAIDVAVHLEDGWAGGFARITRLRT